MGARAKNCTRCGSPMDGSKEVRAVEQPAPPPKKKRRIWPYIVAGIVVLVLAIWWLFIRTHAASVTVTGHRWQRTVAVEEFRDQQQSAWRDQVPGDASFPVCQPRQRSTRQIADGEDCHTERHDKKDGTFEQVRKCKTRYRSEPVADNWCTFNVRRWAKVDELVASGSGSDAAWPISTLTSDVQPMLRARKLGARSEHLLLELGGDTCDLSQAPGRQYTECPEGDAHGRAPTGAALSSPRCNSVPG